MTLWSPAEHRSRQDRRDKMDQLRQHELRLFNAPPCLFGLCPAACLSGGASAQISRRQKSRQAARCSIAGISLSATRLRHAHYQAVQDANMTLLHKASVGPLSEDLAAANLEGLLVMVYELGHPLARGPWMDGLALWDGNFNFGDRAQERRCCADRWSGRGILVARLMRKKEPCLRFQLHVNAWIS